MSNDVSSSAGGHVWMCRSTYLDDRLVVNLALLVDRSSVNLDDLEPTLLVRQGDLDLSVQSSRSEERGVERVRSVGGHDDLGSTERVETVHLVEKLKQTTRECLSDEEVELGRVSEGRTSISVLWISRSALVPSENRLPPIASISSMKMIHGSCSFA